MVQEGVDVAVMEVSSQALAQQRVAGLHYEVAAFTNLTQDHLDYHGTFENYIAAKHKLFENCDKAVVNADDEAYKAMIEGTSCSLATCSALRDSADYSAKNIEHKPGGVSYFLVGIGKLERIKMRIPGGFTVYNSMTAAVCAIQLGLPFADVAAALSEATGVPGRIEVVPTDTDYTVIIDYAHSPDGLENIISSLRKIAKARKIAVLGDMLELGDYTETAHRMVGDYAAECQLDALFTLGESSGFIADSAKNGGLESVFSFTDKAELTENLKKYLQKGDTVLFKASRGMKLEEIFEELYKHWDV